MQLTKSLLHTTDTYIQKLAQAGVVSVENLLTFFPRAIEDKSDLITRFVNLNVREKQAIRCTIELLTSEITRNKKTIIKAVLVDDDGNYAEAVWFGRVFLLQQFRAGDNVVIYTLPKYEYGKLSFPKADIEHYQEKRREIVPVYSDLNYIPGTWIREKILLVRDHISLIPEDVPENIRIKNSLREIGASLESIHFPTSVEDFERAKREIGYRELFHFQKIGLEKKYSERAASLGSAVSISLDAELIRTMIASLPYALTNKQKIVLFQILRDMESPYAMSRMLQGDVGTGKTIVAILAAIHAISVARREGRSLQVAIMAPTEILARQHFDGEDAWLASLGIRADLLVGSLTSKQKKSAGERLQNGETDIVFGTHALIQEGVHFAHLGFVVVDEQHRFGVEQRKLLEEYISQENPESHIVPHVLNMTATPIPRSLALTLYGDQDISVLDEYPAGRKPIHTRVVKEIQRTEIYRFIEEEVKNGRQVYWISPLVSESETLDVASATETFEMLELVFPEYTIGLLHGRMNGKEKDRIMQEFYENMIQILSSTSVVEVGVNNPNATIICIEAAERFGLSQLHQFRGRVGRGEHQSYCYLFTTQEYKNDRLRAMEQTNDGFELAEIDLELRGPGEVYGVRQSGLPDLHFADLRDVELIAQVRADIEAWILDKNPR